MTKTNQTRSSKRFLQNSPKKPYREIFAEGDWLNISENLSLNGWEVMQREHIRSFLQMGIPLSHAVRRVAEISGRCPIHSKELF